MKASLLFLLTLKKYELTEDPQYQQYDFKR